MLIIHFDAQQPRKGQSIFVTFIVWPGMEFRRKVANLEFSYHKMGFVYCAEIKVKSYFCFLDILIGVNSKTLTRDPSPSSPLSRREISFVDGGNNPPRYINPLSKASLATTLFVFVFVFVFNIILDCRDAHEFLDVQSSESWHRGFSIICRQNMRDTNVCA